MKIINEGGLRCGIYFNLPAEMYHADLALSRSDLVNLSDTPNTYWVNSPLNPNRPKRTPTDEMVYGDAFHCMLFEPEKFSKRFQIVPIEPWDETKIKIKYDDYLAIIESIRVLRAGKDSNLFLSGGTPEVTIVFDEAGVRYRVRLDYLTPVVITDFKTIYTLNEYEIRSAFRKYGLDIQMSLYKLAVKRLKEQLMLGEAHVYGYVDPAFFSKFMASKTMEFVFIFQRKTKPYPFEPLMPEDDTEEDGVYKTQVATQTYLDNLKAYGDKPWPVSDGKIKPFSSKFGIRRGN